MNIQLLIIDPQNDFCWPGIDVTGMDPVVVKTLTSTVPADVIKPGSLFVPGAPDPSGTQIFSDMGKGFVSEMISRGMQVSTSVDFLK